MRKKHRFFKSVFVIFLFVFVAWFMLGEGKIMLLKALYPIKYQDCVEKYADEYNLDRYLVYAVIKVESGFDSEATSKVGARGLMQLMEKTALECNEKAEFGYDIPEDLFNPDANIRLGCYYLRSLYENYGDMELAITAYNGGTGNVNEWLNDDKLADGNGGLKEIPYEETKKYVEKVFHAFDTYNKLYKQNDNQELRELL